MRLTSLKLAAFRGVPGELEIDLTAPLTVIYAANGTGKTSICDAVEWLVTGAVKRLGARSATDLRCKFALPTRKTVVSAMLDVSGSSIVLERTQSGCRWAIDGNSLTPVTQSDLLERLAPSAVEEGVHKGHANSSRMTWLRGTRFLSGDALSVLLDADDRSIAERERMFSDLLGVGHLLETERQLEGYISEISRAYRDSAVRVEGKQSAIQRAQAKIVERGDVVSAATLPRAMALLKSTLSILGTDQQGRRLPADAGRATLLGVSSAISAEVAARKERWHRRRQAEAKVLEDFPLLEGAQEQLAEVERKQRDAGAQLESLSTELDAKASAIATAEASLRALRVRLRGTESILGTLERERNLFEPQLRAYLITVQEPSLSVAGMSSIGRNAPPDVDRVIEDHRRTIASLRDKQERQIKLAEARAREAALYASGTEGADAQALAVELKRSERHLDGLQRAYDLLAGPLDKLRLDASNLMATLKDDAHCPVCTHDWKKASDLRSAMERASEELPEAMQALNADIQDARSRTDEFRENLAEAQRIAAEATQIASELKSLQDAEAAFAQNVRDLGYEPGDEELEARLHLSLARLVLTPAAARLSETIEEIRSRYKVAFNDGEVLSVADATAIELTALIEPARAEIENEEGNVDKLRSDERELQEQRKSVELELASLGRQSAQLEASRVSLHGQWLIAADADEELTSAALQKVSASLREEFDRIQSAEASVSEAATLLQGLDDYEELIRLREEMAPLTREQDRLSGLSEAASDTLNAYRSFRGEHVKSQMREVVRVIAALFSRMQANFVFDDIQAGEAASPLSWRAVADTLSMSPENIFSQGQRQDFALSIFLARARSVGGSFLLDEPVVHLDDLNRVALLDVFRALALERDASFILTTANKSVVRHLQEKFALLAKSPNETGEAPLLSIIELDGNPRAGVLVVDQGRARSRPNALRRT